MSMNMTKWRISAHEGSRKPHELKGEEEVIGEGEEKRLERGRRRERKEKKQTNKKMEGSVQGTIGVESSSHCKMISRQLVVFPSTLPM